MKKEKKRILFRVIFTIILFGILYENGERKSQNFSVKVQAAQADENGFVIDENGVLTDYKGHMKNIVVPEGVVKIGENAFGYSYGSYMTSIRLPESLITIEEKAFCNNIDLDNHLKYIEIPSGVTEISPDAFIGCSELSYIDVSEDNKEFTSIQGVLFNKDKTELIKYPEGRNNEVYTIPNGVRVIKSCAFKNCNKLKQIKFPKSLQSIEYEAFNSCINLSDIKIPSNVTEIQEEVFSNCKNLKSIELSENIEEISYELFSNCTSLETIEIPSKVTVIESSAFKMCKKLSRVIFSKNLRKINSEAFSNCDALEEITISSNVKSIGSSCFSECKNLKNIFVSEDNETYASIDGILYDRSKTTLLQYPSGKPLKEYTIVSGTENIKASAFAENIYLEKIILPDSILSIERSAFSGFKNLHTINIPSKVTTIEDYLFNECTNLVHVELAEGITSIGNYAFYGCENLAEIEIPQTVNELGSHVFQECRGLKSITIPKEISKIKSSSFYNCKKLKNVIISEGVTEIEINAFHGCTSLTSIELPEGIKTIGWHAFDIQNLYISLPDSLTNIDESAFGRREGLKIFCHQGTTAQNYANRFHVECVLVEGNLSEALWKAVEEREDTGIIGDTDITVDENGFIITKEGILTNYIGKEENIQIPERVTRIDDNAFYECNILTSVEIQKNVKSIGYAAFSNCSNLEKVVMSVGMLEIEMDAFNSCSSLKEVYMPSTVKEIGRDAFADCINLKEIVLPENLEILYAAFTNCSLESITIPEKVSEVDYFAFDGCHQLKEIKVSENNVTYTSVDGILFKKDKKELCLYPAGKTEKQYKIPEGVSSVGGFISNKNLTYVEMPNSVIKAEDNIFQNCENLESVKLSENLSEISPRMFAHCYHLKEVTIPKKVTEIGTDAFMNCKNLKEIQIPEGVNTIWLYAFMGCTKLESITIPKSIINIKLNAFNNCPNLKGIAVEADSNLSIDDDIISCIKDDFKIYCHADSDFYRYAKEHYLPYEIVSGNTAEAMELALKEKEEFIIDNGVLTAYYGNECYVEIPSNVTKIGDSVFAGNDKIKHIEVSDNVNEIGIKAFENCKNLVSVNLPDSLVSIGSLAFHSCTKLTEIAIPSNIISIGENAFGNCTDMSEIIIINNEKYLEKEANIFKNDRSNNDTNTVEKGNYSSKDGILYTSDFTTLMQYPAGKQEETYAILDTVTTLSSGCFDGCQFLLKIAVLDTVENIASNIFTPESKKCEIYCHRKTAIKEYADKNMLSVVIVDDEKEVEKEMQEDWEKEQIIIGDVDNSGKVDVNDALIVLKIAANLITPTEEQRKAADVSGDGKVDSGDALLILKYAAGLITNFD